MADNFLFAYMDVTKSPLVNKSNEIFLHDGNASVVLARRELYMGTVEAVITSMVWILILLSASIGNILVILAIFTYPALYIVQNFLLVSLACADILVRAFLLFLTFFH
jgi:hypothetical protein